MIFGSKLLGWKDLAGFCKMFLQEHFYVQSCMYSGETFR